MTTRSDMSSFSTRSRRTAAQQQHSITHNDVQYFLLQTAVLIAKQQLQSAAAQAAAAAGTSTPPTSHALTTTTAGAGAGAGAGSTSAALAAAAAAARRANDAKSDSWVSNVSGGISQLSLSSLLSLSSSSSGSVRFPEKLIKRLNERLQLISFAKDPSYTSLRFRATVGAFYGQLNDKAFMARIRSDRKVEDLIIAFVTTAQKRLSAASSETMTAEERTTELESQVGSFVKVIRECLRQIHGVPKELMDRLDKYSASFGGTPIVLGNGAGTGSARDNVASSSIGSASGMAAALGLRTGTQSPPLPNNASN
ncbi:unnamed protein product, partial [Tilletia controversa]